MNTLVRTRQYLNSHGYGLSKPSQPAEFRIAPRQSNHSETGVTVQGALNIDIPHISWATIQYWVRNSISASRCCLYRKLRKRTRGPYDGARRVILSVLSTKPNKQVIPAMFTLHDTKNLIEKNIISFPFLIWLLSSYRSLPLDLFEDNE